MRDIFDFPEERTKSRLAPEELIDNLKSKSASDIQRLKAVADALFQKTPVRRS
jgi:hypothetical protein